MLLAQPHRFAQHMHQLVLQLLHRLLQPLALRLRQRLELVRRHHFAVLARREGETHRRADHQQAVLLRLGADLEQPALGALLEVGVQPFQLGGIFLRLEGRGNGAAQLLDERAHVGPAAARRGPAPAASAIGRCGASKLLT